MSSLPIVYKNPFLCVLSPLAIGLGVVVAALGSGCSGTSSDSTATDMSSSSERTLDSCTTSIAADVPEFFKTYFRCVSITAGSLGPGSVVIKTDALPPHKSYYYPADSPNFAPFDFSRGSMYRVNPNKLSAKPFAVEIAAAPVAKTITITAALVDKMARTSNEEYQGGSVGIALDGVALFNATAAPGDSIDQERFTFDNYEAHPAPDGSYHYHGPSPGPLEALKHLGISTSATVGSASPEVFGIMCDGTLVLGCTELDGSALPTTGFDAQNGHVHDLKDKSGKTHFTGRYHTHLCTSRFTSFNYTPEIQYYNACRVTR